MTDQKKLTMTDTYVCQSGRAYWYFAGCSPHPHTMAEAWV
jgi:hypothetical protein